MKALKFLFIPILIFASTLVNAQGVKPFPEDSAKFNAQMKSIVLGVDKKKYKELMDEFEQIWMGPSWTPEQRKSIYKIANVMVKARMRPVPDFENLAIVIVGFGSNPDLNESHWNGWISSVDQLLESKNKKKLNVYLERSGHLFVDNLIYDSPSVSWESRNTNYKFEFDGKEPKIVFEGLDLICYAANDSSVIKNTKGYFLPISGMWFGESGKITWRRAGLSEDTVYATFDKYRLKMKSSAFKVDSATFYTSFLKEPVMGVLREKVVTVPSPDQASYPKFETYQKHFVIENIFEGINFEGGFSISGAKIMGSGDDENPAKMMVYKNGQPFLEAKSRAFAIKPDKIFSERARVVIMLDDDSLTHPGIFFKYLEPTRQLTLLRGKDGMAKSPFFSSYHQVEMNFEALYWVIDDMTMDFQAIRGGSDNRVWFESNDYFSAKRYENLRGMDPVHPLIHLKDVTKMYDTTVFTLTDLAKQMRMQKKQVLPTVIHLSLQGFIDYNQDTEVIVVKPRTFHYIWAMAGKEDYDRIIFFSDLKKSTIANASLNLENNEIIMRGVENVCLSDSQSVYMWPSGKKIILMKNRDFRCAGVFEVGQFNFFGKEFNFNYEDFKMELLNVDSMKFKCKEFPGEDVKYRKVKLVRSVLEGTKGTVYIDHPKNKSGVSDQVTDFPKFDCTEESYVYYDNRGPYKHAYHRDEYYFRVDPFFIDSLDNFETLPLEFPGTFVSAGIFPDFEESLKIQKDYSLGFERVTPEGGFDLFKNKGTANYDNEIRLSNNGLRGGGKITFLTSEATSDDFLFYPDSTAGQGLFVVNESESGPETPQVRGEDSYINYIPAENHLSAKSMEKPLSMFNGETDMTGTVYLNPKGLSGDGVMDFEKATLTSNQFAFGKREANADTSAFRLKNTEESAEKGFAFKTENVNSHLDFEKRYGEFKSNGENSFVEFPSNQYICYMDMLKWFMDTDNLDIEASEQQQDAMAIDTDLDLKGSNFYSVNEDQDSLNFMSPKARYDLKDNILYCHDVDYILTGDVTVSPDSGLVTIRKNANMEEFTNALITANYTNQYHKIFNAKVKIEGRNSYYGEGDLNYTDMNGMEQIIHLSEVKLDSTLETIATGEIEEDAGFTLSPQFSFKGEVTMVASNKFLTFSGATKISHTCDKISRNYMKFEAEIDPKDILIPVAENIKDPHGIDVSNGVIMVNDSIYATFLSRKKNGNHQEAIKAHGYMRYDKNTQEYQISNLDKLKQKSLPGNFVSLNVNSCDVTGNGRLDLGVALGMVKMENIGEITLKGENNEVLVNTSLKLNFPFNEKVLDRMADMMIENVTLPGLDFVQSQYETSLREELGVEESDKLITDLNVHGKIKKMPEELASSIYISDVSFKWDNRLRSYVSVGKIGIASIQKKQVFKYVEGNIRIRRKRSGDEITIYLKIDDDNWFFFNYRFAQGTQGIMEVLSSDKEFNDALSATDEDKRKVKDGKLSFLYQATAKSRLTKFLRELETE